MGREIKRVPASFDWPINKVWAGAQLPKRLHSTECVSCKGTGYNTETRCIADDFYDHAGFGVRWAYDYGTAPDGSKATRPPWRVLGVSRAWHSNVTQDEVEALVAADRLWDLTRTWTRGEGWQPRADGHVPTAAEVNHWNQHSMGHDAINRSILVQARATRLGVYGFCPVCSGEASIYPDEATKAEAEAWEPTPVPSGEWWQVWETVSEGSPVTPPFATAAELIDHLVAHGDAWDQKRGRPGWSRESATRLVEGGWAASMIVVTTEDGALAATPRDLDVVAKD